VKKAIIGHTVTKIYRDDSGIADAWNHALSQSNSQYAIFLGRGDLLSSDSAISELIRARNRFPIHMPVVVYGNQYVLGKANQRQSSLWSAAGKENRLMRSYMCIPHPSSLWPVALLRISGFSSRYRIAIDYDVSLRWNNILVYTYVDIDVTCVEPGGVSNRPSKMLQVISEDMQIKTSYGLPPCSGVLVNIKRILRWLLRI